jgi:diketogulonate reductase-like aldo/keto reductase
MAVGTYRLKGKDAERVVYDAVCIGYRHIDTAAVYMNEAAVGAAIRRLLDEKIVRRDDLFITSKISPKSMGYTKTQECIHQSLVDLGISYIDLMLVHWPGSQGLRGNDPRNKLIRLETVKALTEQYRSGILKAIGVSNFNRSHFDGLEAVDCLHVNQIEFHPLQWTKTTQDLVEYCQHERHMLIGAYSCLGEGRLLNAVAYPEVADVAKVVGATMAQVLIAWAMRQGCLVMPKASSKERLIENFMATHVHLSEKDIAALNAMVERVGSTKFCWDPSTIT